MPLRHWSLVSASFLLFLVTACGEGIGPDNTTDIARIVVDAADPAPITGGIIVGDARQLKVFLLDSADHVLPERPVSWFSSDPGIATVTSTGLVTGLQAGYVTITAAVGSKSGTYLTDIIPLASSLEFLPSRLGLVPGGVYDLVVIFRDASGAQLDPSGRSITWDNNNPLVASLTGAINASVRGLAAGVSTLTATGSGASGSVQVDVSAVEFATIFAGGRHSCGVSSGSVAYCWGSNVQNLLASPVGNYSAAPFRIEGIGSATAIVSGGGHVCILTPAGDSYCWGYGAFGQLGDGTADPTVNGIFPPERPSAGITSPA